MERPAGELQRIISDDATIDRILAHVDPTPFKEAFVGLSSRNGRGETETSIYAAAP
jgi:hypothetical protein